MVSLTSLPVGGSDKLKSNVSQEYNVVKTQNTKDVEIGGVEPPKRGLSDPPGKPAIPTSESLSQNDLENSRWPTMSQAEWMGWFKVAIDTPIDKEIKFNWWIIN